MEIHDHHLSSTQPFPSLNTNDHYQPAATAGYSENQNSPSSSSSSLSAASTSSTTSSILTAVSTASSSSSSAFPALMGEDFHSNSSHYFPPLNLSDHSAHSPKSVQPSVNTSSSFASSINISQARNPHSSRSHDGEHESNLVDNLNSGKAIQSFHSNEMYSANASGSEYANYSNAQYTSNAFHQQYDSLPTTASSNAFSALPAAATSSNTNISTGNAHGNGNSNTNANSTAASSLLRHSIACLECNYPLDDDDLSFAPCQCGARLCLLCFDSHLSHSTECPSCRRSISIGQFSQQFVDEYRMALQLKVDRRQQQQQQHSVNSGSVSALHGGGGSSGGFSAHQSPHQNYLHLNQQQQQNHSPYNTNRKKFVRSPQLNAQTNSAAHHSPIFNPAAPPLQLNTAQHAHLVAPNNNVNLSVNQHSPNFGSVNSNQPNSPVLTSARVLQRNLMYVVGLPVHLAKEDILKKKEYFGKFGKIIKIAISKKTVNANQKGENSSPLSTGLGAPNERSLYSAYVTFRRDEDCATSIRCTNGANLGGSIVRATYGTNKYCSWFLKGQPCNSSQCLYLHSSAPDEDCCTKEDLLVMDKLAKMNINAEREELKQAQTDESIIHQFISALSQQQLQNFAQLAQTINVYQLNYLSFLVPVISEVLNMNINVDKTPNAQERHLIINSNNNQNATNVNNNRATFHSAFFSQQQQQQPLVMQTQQVQVMSNPRDRSSSGGGGNSAANNPNATGNAAAVGSGAAAAMNRIQGNRPSPQLLNSMQNNVPIRLSPVEALHQNLLSTASGVNYEAAIQQQLVSSSSWSSGGNSDFHSYSSRSGYGNYNSSNQSPQPHGQSHSQSQSPNQHLRNSHSATSTPTILASGRSIPSPPPGASSAASASSSAASSSRSSPQVFSARSAYSPNSAANPEIANISSASHAQLQSDYVKSIYEDNNLLEQHSNSISRGVAAFDDYPPTQHEHYTNSRNVVTGMDNLHANSSANFHYQAYQQQQSQQGNNSPFSPKQLLQSPQQKDYSVAAMRSSSRFYNQQAQQPTNYMSELASEPHSSSSTTSEQSNYSASASSLTSSPMPMTMNSMFHGLSLTQSEPNSSMKKANANHSLTPASASTSASAADVSYSLFNNSFNSSVASSSAPSSLNGSPSRSMTLPIGKRSASPNAYVNAYPLMNLNVNSATNLSFAGNSATNFQLPGAALPLSSTEKHNQNEWTNPQPSIANNVNTASEDNGTPSSAPSSTSSAATAAHVSFFGSSSSPFQGFHSDASPSTSTATLGQTHSASLATPFLHYKQPHKAEIKVEQQSFFSLF